MDAMKMNKVNKVCEEITKAVVPLGLKPDFSGVKEGKGPVGFSMSVSFGSQAETESGPELFDQHQKQ